MIRLLSLLWIAATITLFTGWAASHEFWNPEETILRVEVHPKKIHFERPYASAQLLIQGYLEDGTSVDLTRQAVFLESSDLVQVDERGRIHPISNGQGRLRLLAGEHTIEIPISIQGMDQSHPVDFIRDVQPILSRLGCNSGSCHGAAKGKNGFKLSLRGYDPSFDHQSLTDDLAGRRFNRAVPDQSLFLLKATASVPHEGGRILSEESSDYALLRQWIAGGAKFDPTSTGPKSLRVLPEEIVLAGAGSEQQFAILATYDNGAEVDVTAKAFIEVSDTEILSSDDSGLVEAKRRGEATVLARFEGRYATAPAVVMGDRSDFQWKPVPAFNKVDQLVYAKLKRVRVQAGDLCTDAEFLRRIYLDLTGRPPTVTQTRTFLLDRRKSRIKREELIDRLIGSAEFVEYWTHKWSDMLQVNRKYLGEEGARKFQQWIQEQIASNRPYDRFVQDVLGASGSTAAQPAASYYKIHRQADLVMENTTQLFLGVRFNCNKCHDHPFERWTRSDHWQLAATFARVDRKPAPGAPKLPRTGVEEALPAVELISDATEGELVDPDTGQELEPRFPFQHQEALPPGLNRRQGMVAWLTAAENPYFAKSYVNRIWSYFTGTGFIEPVDDIRASNPPSNPELLEELTRGFIDSGFDVRALMRRICRSRTYQLSVRSNPWNADDQVNYSHAKARRLSAEVLHNALVTATGSKTPWSQAQAGTPATALLDSSFGTPDGFLDLFGRPARESSCECERNSGVSLGQALNLINGPTVAEAIADPQNKIADLLAIENDSAHILEQLYLSFLTRFPSPQEVEQLLPSLDGSIPENRFALPPAELAALESEFQKWQQSIRIPEWTALEVRLAEDAQGRALQRRPGGSVAAAGEAAAKDRYLVVGESSLARVTGVRLEALSDPELPAKGPGRAENGNFVLHELKLFVVPYGNPIQSRHLKWKAASANFSQNGWPVAHAIDGKNNTGWAVSPRFGQNHQAVFELSEDLSLSGPNSLVFHLDQAFGTQHILGHFRISLTDSPRPVRHHALPPDVLAAFRVPELDRSQAQTELLFRHFLKMKPAHQTRIRHAASRDLAWALANSPEFLFNH
ncbi:MAG: DUF1553 domain-containing protein [Planctomycetota bacterium]|nr:MAG: DUF1553 domain-containing protein [Planctomycetota bacterium]